MSTYDLCEACGGYRGVVFLNGTTEGDLVGMGLLHRCTCPEYAEHDMRSPTEKRLDEIIALLKELRDQGKPKEGKASTPGPFMTGVPE